MYTRWAKFGGLAIEDGLIVLALLCLIGDLAIQQHMWNLGLGDMPNVSPENVRGIMQMIVPGSTLYVSSLWAVKFALVLFYKRLAAPGSRLVTIYNVAIGGLVVTFLVIFFDIVFQCYPHDKRWSTDPDCRYSASDQRTSANVEQISVTQKQPTSTTGSLSCVSKGHPRRLPLADIGQST